MSANGSQKGMFLPEEDESYFVSMTDMMVGMIFIFIILLMTFALSYRDAEEKRQVKVEQLTTVRKARTAMLEDIEKALKKEGIKVEIDTENGILHLPEEILFPSGSATLNSQGTNSLQHLARALYFVIPCYAYTSEPLLAGQCDTESFAKLDAIFVEGHTDNVPIGAQNKFQDNWELSAQRAIVTYKALIKIEPNLDGLTNSQQAQTLKEPRDEDDSQSQVGAQKLFSVAGYGEFRPRNSNRTVENRQKNRRIDLRFLMKTPRPEDLDIVEEQIAVEAGIGGS